MADNSTLASTTGSTGLADSSIFDSKVVETSKENLCIRSASHVLKVNMLSALKCRITLLIVNLTD